MMITDMTELVENQIFLVELKKEQYHVSFGFRQ